MIRKRNQNEKRNYRLTGVDFYEGESMIRSLRRKLQNKEQIPVIMDTAYTDKSVGVLEGYNIRTDRFEIGQREAERIGKYKNAKKLKQKGAEPTKAEEVKAGNSTGNE